MGYALTFPSRQENSKINKSILGKRKKQQCRIFHKNHFPIIYHQQIRNRYVKDRLQSLNEILNHISETYTSIVTERVC